MEKTAIILAVNDDGLQPVFSTPAVRRLILLLRRMGIDRVHLFGLIHPLVPILEDLVPAPNFHQLDGPTEVAKAVNALVLSDRERVLILTANLVIDQYSLSRFLSAEKSNTDLFIMPANGGSGTDGLYLGGPSDLVPILKGLWSANMFPAGIRDNAHRIPGVAGLPHTVGREDDRITTSEAKLTSALSVQTAANDGFLARHFDRRISRFFSKRLSHTGIAPNQITLCGVAIGLMGAFLLSQPGYWSQLFGALLFLFCVIVDGVDGEVARLKLQESRFGHYLDIVTDNLVHLAVFSGIALGLYRASGDAGYLRALGFLMGGFGLCAVAVYDCILRRRPAVVSCSSKTLRLMVLLSNRDFAYLIVVLAAVHRLNWFLIGAAVGSYLFAAALWAIRFYENRGVSQSGV